MSNKLQQIPLANLLPHPANPNVMSKENFRKLVRNIERTGRYEPIVVRPHPKKKEHFQIINGHHRVKALQQLACKEADCIVWDVDDEQTDILLATLNRLCGRDELSSKLALLRRLNKKHTLGELGKLLPQTAKQIERLCNLSLSAKPPLAADAFAIPLVFFVTEQQKQIIEQAISIARQTAAGTKAQQRAAALAAIARSFIEDPDHRPSGNVQHASDPVQAMSEG